jgi:hypothetical protein
MREAPLLGEEWKELRLVTTHSAAQMVAAEVGHGDELE